MHSPVSTAVTLPVPCFGSLVPRHLCLCPQSTLCFFCIALVKICNYQDIFFYFYETFPCAPDWKLAEGRHRAFSCLLRGFPACSPSAGPLPPSVFVAQTPDQVRMRTDISGLGLIGNKCLLWQNAEGSGS